jgi:hypothetical protein
MQRKWQPILLLLLAGGFAITVVELLLTGHVKGIQLVGVIAPAVALVCVLTGLFAHGTLRAVMAAALLVVSLAGLLGAWEHFEEGGRQGSVPALAAQGERYQPVSYQAAAVADEGNEGRERAEGGESGGNPPPLAPLAISGLALMAAVVLFVPEQRPT